MCQWFRFVAVVIETLAGGHLFFQSYSKPYHMEFLNKNAGVGTGSIAFQNTSG